MTVLHTGSTKKYSEGWQAIFSKSAGKKAATSEKKAAAGKKIAKGAKKAAGAKKKPAKKAKRR